MAMPIEFLITLLLFSIKSSAQPASVANDSCQSRCGNVSIPYPFGIGAGCYLDNWFSIICNVSFELPKPFLKSFNLEVLSISVDGTVRVNYPTFSICTNGSITKVNVQLGASHFFFSQSKNKFIAMGCNEASMQTPGRQFMGCTSRCEKAGAVANGANCTGINCCQTPITSDLVAFNTTMTFRGPYESCRSAFLVEEGWFQDQTFVSADLSNTSSHVPVVLEWGISETSFRSLSISDISTLSDPNSSYNCSSRLRTNERLAFTCSCQRGFRGNPYLSQGCKDIDECSDPSYNNVCLALWRNGTSGYCTNLEGSYSCSQTKAGNGGIVIGTSTSLGLLVLVVGGWWSYKVIKKRRTIKQKEKFFKRNGGLLLQQQLSSHEANVEKAKLFSSKELEKATDHFDKNRILGQGGQGTVYKGMLTNGQIVAVKKSKVIDEEKLEEFINEVGILSQINHRNVVKLLGCCLETEVPLLVYEYVPNGNLSQFLNNQAEEFPPTWHMCLQIATEVAGALYYLHSAASLPIYHRDIKSTNILLDDKYRVKVADFGTSRSIAIDQTHLTTRVHGTFGYLDPEYFQSSQFTEKSDVYSFGVVLAELLTREKAISSTRTQETRSLATYFIKSMEENKLFDIVDNQVLKEANKEEIIAVANLAIRCLSLNGKRRPTMREVARELEVVQVSQKAPPLNHDNEELEYVTTEMYKGWDAFTTTTSGMDSGTTSSVETRPFLS